MFSFIQKKKVCLLQICWSWLLTHAMPTTVMQGRTKQPQESRMELPFEFYFWSWTVVERRYSLDHLHWRTRLLLGNWLGGNYLSVVRRIGFGLVTTFMGQGAEWNKWQIKGFVKQKLHRGEGIWLRCTFNWFRIFRLNGFVCESYTFLMEAGIWSHTEIW